MPLRIFPRTTKRSTCLPISTAADVAAAGGPAGPKAMIAEKTRVGLPALMDNATDLLRDLHVALEPHRKGKRVEKGAMKPVLIHRSRLLRQQLKSLTWMPFPLAPGTARERSMSCLS